MPVIVNSLCRFHELKSGFGFDRAAHEFINKNMNISINCVNGRITIPCPTPNALSARTATTG